MFSSNKFMVYLRKPQVYDLRRMVPIEERKQILKQLQDRSSKKITISNSNPIYRDIHEIVKREEEQERQKYQDSFLWSPRFTPQTFKWRFLPFAAFAALLILYIHFISVPRNMMEWKKRTGIRFEQLEKSGRLSGWYDEYYKPDKTLQFQVYSLQDIKKLDKDGLLRKKQQKDRKRVQGKFMSGNKQFILNQFKSN